VSCFFCGDENGEEKGEEKKEEEEKGTQWMKVQKRKTQFLMYFFGKLY